VKPNGDFPISGTSSASHLALVPVVDAVATTHRPRPSVVPVGWTPRGALTRASAPVDRGDTPRPIRTLLIAARVYHLCGEDVATCTQFAQQQDKGDSTLHCVTHLALSLPVWLHVHHHTHYTVNNDENFSTGLEEQNLVSIWNKEKYAQAHTRYSPATQSAVNCWILRYKKQRLQNK